MPYKEEETETVLPFRGGFRRGSWNARRALLRPLYCLLVGDNISVLLSALGTPSGLLEQSLGFYLERPKGFWNGPPLRGVRGGLERPSGAPCPPNTSSRTSTEVSRSGLHIRCRPSPQRHSPPHESASVSCCGHPPRKCGRPP